MDFKPCLHASRELAAFEANDRATMTELLESFGEQSRLFFAAVPVGLRRYDCHVERSSLHAILVC